MSLVSKVQLLSMKRSQLVFTNHQIHIQLIKMTFTIMITIKAKDKAEVIHSKKINHLLKIMMVVIKTVAGFQALLRTIQSLVIQEIMKMIVIVKNQFRLTGIVVKI